MTYRPLLMTLLLMSMPLSFIKAQCNGSNTFLGTTNANWHIASNWSANCTPTLPIIGMITISANCILQDTTSYLFHMGGNLTINSAVKLSVIYGDPSAPVWLCGDLLNYGNENYETVLIGNQCWMAENLNIGTMIPINSNQSNNNIIEKYCLDDNPTKCNTYGGLYMWNEMMKYTTLEGAQGLCPTGWHIPSEADFTTLENALPPNEKGSSLASNANLWEDGILDQSNLFNSSGFHALPGGLFDQGSTFSDNFNAFMWTSTSQGNIASYLNMYFDNADMLYGSSVKSSGYSIRCVKD